MKGRVPRGFYGTEEGQKILVRLRDLKTRKDAIHEVVLKFGVKPESVLSALYHRGVYSNGISPKGLGTALKSAKALVAEVRELRDALGKERAVSASLRKDLQAFESVFKDSRLKRAGAVAGS